MLAWDALAWDAVGMKCRWHEMPENDRWMGPEEQPGEWSHNSFMIFSE